jgi:hypothetical protein
VLGLGRVGDLAADPRQPEHAHVVALVRVADQIELDVAKDEVVGVDLAVGDLVALERVVAELDRLATRDRRLDLGQALRELAAAAGRRELDVDRRAVVLGKRARAPPRDLLQRQAQRLRVGELAVEEPQRGAQGRQLGVRELDRGEVVVLGRQGVELGLEEAVGGLVDLQRDAEALELGAVGVETARERVLVHRAVALDLPLDLQRRHRATVGHQERDQRELANQLLCVLGHRVRRIVSVSQRPSRYRSLKSQIPPWPASPPCRRRVECPATLEGRAMIGAGTFINPLLKIVTVVAVLAATYFFIIEPVLDTTESISSEVNNSIGQSLQSTNDQIDRALERSGTAQTIEIPQSSQDSLKEANRLLDCIQRANGNVEKIQRCNR